MEAAEMLEKWREREDDEKNKHVEDTSEQGVSEALLETGASKFWFSFIFEIANASADVSGDTT